MVSPYANTGIGPLMAASSDGSIQAYLVEPLTPNTARRHWTLMVRSSVRFDNVTALTVTLVKTNF